MTKDTINHDHASQHIAHATKDTVLNHFLVGLGQALVWTPNKLGIHMADPRVGLVLEQIP